MTVFEISGPQPRLLRRLAAGADAARAPRASWPIRACALVEADGRAALTHDERRYDLIEADALWPEAAYGGNLYSVEFFRRGAARLKPGGIICTWAPTPRIYASFSRVFPHVVGLPSRDILFGIQRADCGWSGGLARAPLPSGGRGLPGHGHGGGGLPPPRPPDPAEPAGLAPREPGRQRRPVPAGRVPRSLSGWYGAPMPVNVRAPVPVRSLVLLSTLIVTGCQSRTAPHPRGAHRSGRAAPRGRQLRSPGPR